MIDLEFRLRATRPERFQALQFRDVGDSVLYHSLPGLVTPRVQWTSQPIDYGVHVSLAFKQYP